MAPATIVASASQDGWADFSPDGRFIAYMSDESGEFRIYVQELESSRQWAVSPGFGVTPIWSRNGDEIFYGGSGGINVAEVTMTPEFRVVETRSLFQSTARGFTNFDVTRDGQRFLFVQPAGVATSTTGAASPPQPTLRVVLGWFEELNERVPTGR